MDATTSSSKLYSIGSHSLELFNNGTHRIKGNPVVVIIPGLASSRLGWAAFIRLLSPFIQIVSYNRSGFGNSSKSPKLPTAVNIALDLDLLLKAACIEGPYILVAHSWGGILSREFIALDENRVVGLVLVDSNQEKSLETLNWKIIDNFLNSIENFDYLDVSGQKVFHKLTDEEWSAYIADEESESYKIQSPLEIAEYDGSFPVLAAKKQMERKILKNRPVAVVRGRNEKHMVKYYKAWEDNGKGTEEEKKIFQDFIATFLEKDIELQTEQLNLSYKGKVFVAEESGHNIQLQQPEVIVDAVKWVLEEYSNGY